MWTLDYPTTELCGGVHQLTMIIDRPILISCVWLIPAKTIRNGFAWPWRFSFPTHRLATAVYSSTAYQQRTQLQSGGHEPGCLVPEWTSICMCLTAHALFRLTTTYILRAFHPADTGITTATTLSALHALCLRSWPTFSLSQNLSVSSRCYTSFSATVKLAVTMAVHMTCEMHISAFQCIARPYTTLLDCIGYT